MCAIMSLTAAIEALRLVFRLAERGPDFLHKTVPDLVQGIESAPKLAYGNLTAIPLGDTPKGVYLDVHENDDRVAIWLTACIGHHLADFPARPCQSKVPQHPVCDRFAPLR